MTHSPKVSNPAPKWDSRARALVLDLHREHKTSYQITDALEAEGYTFSREAVCGQIHRMQKRGWLDRRRGHVAPYDPKMPTISTLPTGAVLGTFLERLCDIGQW